MSDQRRPRGRLPSSLDASAYQARFDALAASGVDVHGEAALVRSYEPATVLDGGCGTGRVAIELHRHGIDVVGVDVDPAMIAEARRLAPTLEFLERDLAELELGRRFDVVVLAGNVPLFCPPERRRQLIVRSAAHVAPGGVLLTGFQLGAATASTSSTGRRPRRGSSSRAAGPAGTAACSTSAATTRSAHCARSAEQALERSAMLWGLA